jgi:hypothetical protein
MPEQDKPSDHDFLSESLEHAPRMPASAYLEPEGSPFSQAPRGLCLNEHELQLAMALLAPLKADSELLEDYSMYSRTASVVCIGGYMATWALWVHEETPSKFSVLWNKVSGFQKPIKVQKCELPAELGSAVCDAWEKVLSQTRYPKVPESGSYCDGIWYHFGFRSKHRNMAGKTWSPPEDTHPGKLAAMANALRDYVEDDGQSKPTIIRTIENHAEWLLTRRPHAGHRDIRVLHLRKGPPDNSAPCPSCGKPLRTPKAKQCRFCGKDWH